MARIVSVPRTACLGLLLAEGHTVRVYTSIMGFSAANGLFGIATIITNEGSHSCKITFQCRERLVWDCYFRLWVAVLAGIVGFSAANGLFGIATWSWRCASHPWRNAAFQCRERLVWDCYFWSNEDGWTTLEGATFQCRERLVWDCYAQQELPSSVGPPDWFQCRERLVWDCYQIATRRAMENG
jgi:hypothetical protein